MLSLVMIGILYSSENKKKECVKFAKVVTKASLSLPQTNWDAQMQMESKIKRLSVFICIYKTTIHEVTRQNTIKTYDHQETCHWIKMTCFLLLNKVILAILFSFVYMYRFRIRLYMRIACYIVKYPTKCQ